MSDHKHGEMNTFSQQKMFEKFVKFTTRSIYVIIAVLIFMAIVGA
ncbi:MAG: aa3-type cytochrome c oxidase subunit IV [Rhodobacterales bacterium]|nr:aa3-type cytochrome c oxidase subunit IV [Rhodobacterales bacterium]